MKNTIRQVFHSSKFVTGFVIFMIILVAMFVYPLFNPGDPLEQLGIGTFTPPGTYFSVYDATNAPRETLRLPDAEEKRTSASLSTTTVQRMMKWFEFCGLDVASIDTSDTDRMLELWDSNYNLEMTRPKGITNADWRNLKLVDKELDLIKAADEKILASEDPETGELIQTGIIKKDDYVSVNTVTNVKVLPLGTDNFGRDVLKELLSACKTSILIGLIAGAVATFIGLTLGLLAGYVGGFVDDLIMFITNIFTVIPGFVLLILISYSLGQEQRGAAVVAVVIGFTSWTWTCRSVRSQVISLRNRDHVNLSKLSGHSLLRIVLTDILPYIASYVVMAFILQVSSGILSEAQLSLLGLGPKTTEVPTLGLMMNWAMLYSAHTNGSWWAYFPVILTIALISFSLNLMNTGLDQVFNPTLRD